MIFISPILSQRTCKSKCNIQQQEQQTLSGQLQIQISESLQLSKVLGLLSHLLLLLHNEQSRELQIFSSFLNISSNKKKFGVIR